MGEMLHHPPNGQAEQNNAISGTAENYWAVVERERANHNMPWDLSRPFQKHATFGNWGNPI